MKNTVIAYNIEGKKVKSSREILYKADNPKDYTDKENNRERISINDYYLSQCKKKFAQNLPVQDRQLFENIVIGKDEMYMTYNTYGTCFFYNFTIPNDGSYEIIIGSLEYYYTEEYFSGLTPRVKL